MSIEISLVTLLVLCVILILVGMATTFMLIMHVVAKHSRPNR
jgi:hypothetical protein